MKLSQKRGAEVADPVRGSHLSKAVRRTNERTARQGWLLFEAEGRFMIQRIDDPAEVREELRVDVPELRNDTEAIKAAVSAALRGDPLIMFLVWLHGKPVDVIDDYSGAVARLLSPGPVKGAAELAEILGVLP